MKTHARLGSDAIEQAERDIEQPVEFLSPAKEIARWHHENWDGSGYPDGLAGEAIPVSARLMALADVFDALISRAGLQAGDAASTRRATSSWPAAARTSTRRSATPSPGHSTISSRSPSATASRPDPPRRSPTSWRQTRAPPPKPIPLPGMPRSARGARAGSSSPTPRSRACGSCSPTAPWWRSPATWPSTRWRRPSRASRSSA